MRNRPAGQIEPKTQMLLRRRIGDQHQSGHPRLKNQPLAAVQLQHDALAEPSDLVDSPAD